MTDKDFRRERIEKLLHELRYEVERGMMEGEIEEQMGFVFYVPVSRSIRNGVVHCEFRTRPIPAYQMHPDVLRNGVKLRIVK